MAKPRPQPLKPEEVEILRSLSASTDKLLLSPNRTLASSTGRERLKRLGLIESYKAPGIRPTRTGGAPKAWRLTDHGKKTLSEIDQ